MTPLILFAVLLSNVQAWNADVQCDVEGQELYLWSVQAYPGGPSSWLFGTIHVPFQKLRIPDQVSHAIAGSEEFYFEVEDKIGRAHV